MKFLQLFMSRKFWAAVIGLVLIMVQPFAPDFPIAEADAIVNPLVELIGVAVIIGSYIVGTAVETTRKS